MERRDRARALEQLPRLVLPPPFVPERSQLVEALLSGKHRPQRSVSGGGHLLPGPPLEYRDPLLALVHRITLGFSQAEYEHAQALGYDDYLEEQLDERSIDDSAVDARMTEFPSLGMSPRQILDNYAQTPSVPFFQLKGATLVRAVHTRRQLWERMVEFWNDHFSINHQKTTMFALKNEDDLLVERTHALDTFPELLRASASSGAMLLNLDNWLNFAGAPQENYARELLELHTLGVHGGYTEQDVREVAKCFTGWTLNLDPFSPDYLRSEFVESLHEPGDKVVLGVTIPASAPAENALHVLEILSTHPSTARFISRKMIVWLLTETPPSWLVERVAQVYLDTSGDIKSMIRAILAKENIQLPGAAIGPKFRRPGHLMTSLLRGLGANVDDPFFSLHYLSFMGHSPFDWPDPNGYPDRVEAWGRSLLPRWTFACNLMAGDILDITLPLPAILALLRIDGPDDGEGLARRINHRILGRTLARDEERSLQAFIDGLAGPLTWAEVYQAIALGACMSGYQWY